MVKFLNELMGLKQIRNVKLNKTSSSLVFISISFTIKDDYEINNIDLVLRKDGNKVVMVLNINYGEHVRKEDLDTIIKSNSKIKLKDFIEFNVSQHRQFRAV